MTSLAFLAFLARVEATPGPQRMEEARAVSVRQRERMARAVKAHQVFAEGGADVIHGVPPPLSPSSR